MSITNLEQKLFHANFASESHRMQSYLAVHATLLKQKEIPRVYIKNNNNNLEYIQEIVNQIFLSDINKIVENTNKYLLSLQISTKSLNELKHEEKSELVSLIEDLLLNGWGSGEIHYEYLRVYPREHCGISKWLQKLDVIDEKLLSLKKILSARQEDFSIHQKEINEIFSPGFRRYHPTILSRSYELLIEKQWKNKWAHNSNYFVDDNRSVSNLLLLEDL